jgi:hypothetical protein
MRPKLQDVVAAIESRDAQQQGLTLQFSRVPKEMAVNASRI